jgi:hypothetical protein
VDSIKNSIKKKSSLEAYFLLICKDWKFRNTIETFKWCNQGLIKRNLKYNTQLTTMLMKSKTTRGNHFRFGSVRFLSKKVTKPNFFFWKKNRNRTKTDWVRFRFLGQKPVQTGLARFFPVLLGFFVWLSFFFGFGSVFSVFCL